MDNDDYTQLRARIFQGIWETLDPLTAGIEDDEEIPLDVVLPALADMGALGLLIPEEHDGSGLTITQYLPIIAEFAKSQGGIRALVHVHNSFAHAVADLGTEAQKEEILPAAVTGAASVAFALTEPDHGTGLDLGTTAVRDGDDFVLNGRKWLITNSDFATHFLTLAKTSEPGGPPALSALLVPRASAGLTVDRLPETMGCKGGQHGLVGFAGVRVGVDALLGGAAGVGDAQLEAALEISRVLVAASSWGTAERALELSIQHAKSRRTFGRAIAERQAIQRYLAEMATDVYALRTMLRDAAAKWDAGQRIPAEASMCKLFGLEAVGRVTDRALLVHGGIGYTRRHQVERLYRDARLNWIEEGTPTIQYLTAARVLLDGYEWGDFAPAATPVVA